MKNEIQDAIKKIEDFDKKLNLNIINKVDELIKEKDIDSNKKEDLNRTEMFMEDKLSATSFFKKVLIKYINNRLLMRKLMIIKIKILLNHFFIGKKMRIIKIKIKFSLILILINMNLMMIL
jgi:hypothetical protein